MVKEVLHMLRTYSVTFRYLKKNEVFFFLMYIYLYIVYIVFGFII